MIGQLSSRICRESIACQVLECVFEVQEKAYDSPFLLWNGNVGLQRRIVRLRQTDIDGLSHWLQTRLEVDEVEGEFVAY